MFKEVWRKLEEPNVVLDLEKIKKQKEDSELEAEVKVEEEKDSGWKKLDLENLNNLFKNRKN
ncbi:MAG: hypothetical protein WCO07_01170 [bacterium]